MHGIQLICLHKLRVIIIVLRDIHTLHLINKIWHCRSTTIIVLPPYVISRTFRKLCHRAIGVVHNPDYRTVLVEQTIFKHHFGKIQWRFIRIASILQLTRRVIADYPHVTHGLRSTEKIVLLHQPGIEGWQYFTLVGDAVRSLIQIVIDSGLSGTRFLIIPRQIGTVGEIALLDFHRWQHITGILARSRHSQFSFNLCFLLITHFPFQFHEFLW